MDRKDFVKRMMIEFQAAIAENEQPVDGGNTLAVVDCAERAALKAAALSFISWMSLRAIAQLVRAAHQKAAQ
ncbi:MAG: hypothetical protein ABI548_01640 [Polyangiaceae bacterium]